MTRIKICGITRTEDLLAAVRSGANALGFVFYDKSPRCVTAQQVELLFASMPPFVTSVGLFVNPSEEQVRTVIDLIPLDILQFHGEEEPEFCAQFGRPYLKAIRVKAGVNLVQYAAKYASAQGLLLDAFVDGAHGGTGVSFDWGLIPQNLPLPIILSGGLCAQNIAEAIIRVRPYAVDVSSGIEKSKGIKDAVKITAFINEVKQIDLQLS